jgi:glycosyltransferase involved in cell wall biosynthesis
MKFSVVIATYNRADDLAETLTSLGDLTTDHAWELIVVDNNSTDETPRVVAGAAGTFPVPLRYLLEREQGRSAALNAGIRVAEGEIIVVTDDDVRVQPEWLDRAAAALEQLNADYVGGKVLPIWKGQRPAWIPDRGGRHWAVIALLDYGPEAFELGDRAPLGVNMAFRRQAFVRAGLFDNKIGRKAGTLLGQEVREWGQRARLAGLRGFYAPDMVIRHVIPSDRLKKAYFRRWFYWHGVSRAILYELKGLDMESPERTTLDFSKVPHVAGVPRYLYRTFLSSFSAVFSSLTRGDKVATFENELWMWFFAGILRQRWKDRHKPPPVPAERTDAKTMSFSSFSGSGPRPAPGSDPEQYRDDR